VYIYIYIVGRLNITAIAISLCKTNESHENYMQIKHAIKLEAN